jgi:hypothetical protein
MQQLRAKNGELGAEIEKLTKELEQFQQVFLTRF